MKKYFSIIRACPLFNTISDEDLHALLKCLGASVRTYKRKQMVVNEGEPAKYIGIVLSGGVTMIREDNDGNRSILSEVEPSQVFCEAFACAEVSSMPVAVTASKESEIMLIDCNRIMYSCSNACGFHRQLIFNLMKDLADKNLMFHQKLEITSKRTTREKLLAYLSIQSKKYRSNTFSIPFNRQELADYLEVDRSGLSAEISKLRSEGVIASEKNSFTIL